MISTEISFPGSFGQISDLKDHTVIAQQTCAKIPWGARPSGGYYEFQSFSKLISVNWSFRNGHSSNWFLMTNFLVINQLIWTTQIPDISKHVLTFYACPCHLPSHHFLFSSYSFQRSLLQGPLLCSRPVSSFQLQLSVYNSDSDSA